MLLLHIWAWTVLCRRLGLEMHSSNLIWLSKFPRRVNCCLDGLSFICDLRWGFQYTLLCIHNVLTIISSKDFLFLSYLLDVLCVSFIWVGMSFFSLGKFSSIVLLKIWSMPWIGNLLICAYNLKNFPWYLMLSTFSFHFTLLFDIDLLLYLQDLIFLFL